MCSIEYYFKTNTDDYLSFRFNEINAETLDLKEIGERLSTSLLNMLQSFDKEVIELIPITREKYMNNASDQEETDITLEDEAERILLYGR